MEMKILPPFLFTLRFRLVKVKFYKIWTIYKFYGDWHF
jgi:hypothetical protein